MTSLQPISVCLLVLNTVRWISQYPGPGFPKRRNAFTETPITQELRSNFRDWFKENAKDSLEMSVILCTGTWTLN